MKYSHLFVAVALTAPTFSIAENTRECDTVTGLNDDLPASLDLSSPDQLDAFKGCTKLNGHIVIQSDYEGDFILGEVTEISGNISTVEDGAKGLALFDMPNLKKIDHIHLLGISGNVNLPNVESLGDVELIQTSEKGKIDLNSLTGAGNVFVGGSWISTKFDSLKEVQLSVEFCASQDCSIYGPDEEFPYIVVDLPSLEKVDYFNVAGTVKSVSLPKLEIVGYIEWTGLFRTQGLRINIQESHINALNFDAPKLHTLNGTLEIYGSVSSVSLGSLKETDLSATLNTAIPLDFYSTIRTAKSFSVWGKLHSIQLPDISDLGYVSLSYSPRLPCNDTLYQLWETQPDNSSDWDDYNSCLDYDFPRDNVNTNQESTTVPTTTSTATYSSRGKGSTGNGATESATFPTDTHTSSTMTKSTESPGLESGARQSFFVPLTSRLVLLVPMMASCLIASAVFS